MTALSYILIYFHKNVERRVIYDYGKYGDSPNCLGKDKSVRDQVGVLEGSGLTEHDDQRGLLVTKLNIIQNDECYDKIQSANRGILNRYKWALPLGINAGIMCTVGIVNKDGILQVISKEFSFSSNFMTLGKK